MKKTLITIAAFILVVGSTLIQAQALPPNFTPTVHGYSFLYPPEPTDARATDAGYRLWSSDYTPKISRTVTATAEEMESLYPYALMSYFAEMHKVDSSNPNKKNALQARVEILEEAGYQSFTQKSELPETWQKDFEDNVCQRYISSATALQVRLYKNDQNKTISLAIAGTDFISPTSVMSSLRLAFGSVSDTAQEALQLTKDIQKENPEYRIVLTGASQGGAIAQYVVAQTEGTSAVVFNSLGLHSSLTTHLTDDNLIHLFVEGEAMSEGTFHLAGQVIQNSLPVQGKMMPVNDVLSSIITNQYFNAKEGETLTGWMLYRTTSTSFIHHWPGAILETIESHTQMNLPNIF